MVRRPNKCFEPTRSKQRAAQTWRWARIVTYRIDPKEVEDVLSKSVYLPKRLISVEHAVRRLRRTVRQEIDSHMQPWSILLDESVRFFINFERLQRTRKFTKVTSTFAMQIGRLRSLTLSIRDLVYLGQESPAHALTRVFLDDLELAAVIVDDPDFALQYMNEDAAHDEEEFWKQNIGYGRIYPRYHRFLIRAGWTKRAAERQINIHRQTKNVLSGYVHPSPATTFRGLASPSWTHPGKVAIDTLGHTSIHMPGLCLFVASETRYFAASILNLLFGDDPPLALKDYKRKRVSGIAASTMILQELMDKHAKAMKLEHRRRERGL